MRRCRRFVPYGIRLLEATEVNGVLPACVCSSCKSDPGIKRVGGGGEFSTHSSAKRRFSEAF